MIAHRPLSLAARVAPLALLAASCSGGGSGSGSLNIVACTLGCSSSGSGGGGQIACGIQDVFVNGEIHVSFSDPIDPSSLNAFSFQVIEAGTGKSPSAQRFVDPSDPKTVIYRPSLTFDSSGSPVFGLVQDATYTLKLPGVVEDPGAQYIRSTSGSRNEHRMLCTIQATQGVLDANPGPPTVSSFVDVVLAYDPGTGDPIEFAEDVPAPGAVDVYHLSPITLQFNDVMNPGTLVNPVTKTSSTMTVALDPDGDVSDTSDQVLIGGTWSIQVDVPNARTTVVFTPALGFPSAGSDLDDPRRVVVSLSPAIADLGGNPLANPSPIVFTPEVVLFDEVTLQESFDLETIEDVENTGAEWGTETPGALTPGVGGGSGLLGPLVLGGGQVLELDTDSEDFAEIDVSILNPAEALGATFDGTTYTLPAAVDGVFEFSSIDIDSSAVLRFVGSNPARLIVRGEANVRGVVDVGGESGVIHDETAIFGGDTKAPGPSGGAGGAGGDLPTWVGFESVEGTIVPDDPEVPPPAPADLNGAPGIGVPDNLINPTGVYGEGEGGTQWPAALPDSPSDIGDLLYDLFLCEVRQKGGFGGGGAYALDGGSATNLPLPSTSGSPPPPPAAAGGSAADFGLGIGSDPSLPQRMLDPDEGWLHGGAGGGGGGSHVSHSKTNGTLAICTSGPTGPATISLYAQHSSGAGGAGGGGLQLHAGRRIQVQGVLDAGGGSGDTNPTSGTQTHATAGGGGAGGGLLVQSPELLISGTPGRLDISGGAGGVAGAGLNVSKGGNGGAGLLRLETIDTVLNLDTLANVVLPIPATLATVGATPGDVIGIGEMVAKTSGPTALSGAQSCWIVPEGNFFLLDFLGDDGAELGWDLTLLVDGAGEQSYRGENDLFPDPLVEVLGDELGSTPLVVRFQGARASKAITDACNVALTGASSAIVPGSLTAWVKNPADLNTFHANPALSPNMIRFQIVFDATQPNADLIQAVTHLQLRIQPD